MFLMGCDAIRGVTRQASVPHLPPSSCVIEGLESIEGLSNAHHEERTGGWPITLTGLKPPETLHYYFYDFQGVSGWLYFAKDYKGRVEFSQGYITVNKPAPQAEIDVPRPVMVQIERRLETQCTLQNLAANIKESCSGVKCPK
jgi:hypothetical protein